MIEIILLGWIASVLLAVVIGPLGSFVISGVECHIFADTLTHASLLGIVFGLLFKVNLIYAVIGIMLVLAILLAWLKIPQLITN